MNDEHTNQIAEECLTKLRDDFELAILPSEWDDALEVVKSTIEKATRPIIEAGAETAAIALRQSNDTKRLDWLDRLYDFQWQAMVRRIVKVGPSKIREAIDDAMRKEK